MGVPDFLTGASVQLLDFNTEKNTDNNTENIYCFDTEKKIFSRNQENIGS